MAAATQTRKAQTNDAALTAYCTAQREARSLLEALAAQLDAHQNAVTPEEIHWGHVGDITDIVATLQMMVHGDNA